MLTTVVEIDNRDHPAASATENTVTVGALTLGNVHASEPWSHNHSRPRHSCAGSETSTHCIQQPESLSESKSPLSIFYFPPI